MGDGEERFGWWEKVLGVAVCLATILLSVGGGYMVTKSITEYRLTDSEKRINNVETRVDQVEKFGHPDHERRITKLEARADDTDRTTSELAKKLDTAIVILNRIDQKVNKP